MVLQIKFIPIILSDYSYYKNYGYAIKTGEVSKIKRDLEAWNIYIYMNDNHKKAYKFFLGGGVHKGDNITLYYLPNSRSIFFSIKKGDEKYYNYYDKINKI